MNNNWNMSGLIIEGICGSGKTTIMEGLLRNPQFVEKSYHSSIILSEHQTQRVLEQKEREEGLTVNDNIELLDQHVTYLEALSNRLAAMHWCDNKQTNMRIPYILERFHFTHVAHYSHINWKNIKDIDHRLARLNCKICLLTIDESTMEQRIILDRDSGWRNYISRFGNTNAEIVAHYNNQQKLFLEMAERTELEVLVLNTSDTTLTDSIEQILQLTGLGEVD